MQNKAKSELALPSSKIEMIILLWFSYETKILQVNHQCLGIQNKEYKIINMLASYHKLLLDIQNTRYG